MRGGKTEEGAGRGGKRGREKTEKGAGKGKRMEPVTAAGGAEGCDPRVTPNSHHLVGRWDRV